MSYPSASPHGPSPAEYPTAAMPVTHPGLAAPRPYVSGPAGPTPSWPGEALSAPVPGSAGHPPANDPTRGAFAAPGPVQPDSGASRPERPADGERVTVADLALAQRFAAVDPEGADVHVALAVVARRWLAENMPRRWPVAPKVLAATVGALVAALLVGALEWAQTAVPAMAGIPSWVGPVLAVVAPPLAAFLRGYAADHQPRVTDGESAGASGI